MKPEAKNPDKNPSTQEDIELQIEAVLDEIRPAVELDGGNVEFVSFDPATQVVTVRMSGACQGCAMSEITLKQGIEQMMKDRLPQIKEVQTA